MFSLLGKEVGVIIDRPVGSKHPEYGNTYPVNYGYIPNTEAGDGEEVDAYVLGVEKPVNEFQGKAIAVVVRMNDNENKLIVSPNHHSFTEQEIESQIHFQEKFFNTRIIMNELIVTKDIVFRPIRSVDPPIIHKAYKDQGWNKPVSLYENYLVLQKEKARDIIVAHFKEEFAGYLTIQWKSDYDRFAVAGIPEIVDFNVLKKYQKMGIGTILMDEAERRIKKVSDLAGIGVGVLADYGPAHILYFKRGYTPDGRGLTVDNESIPYGKSIEIDDGVVFHMTKDL